MTNSMLLKITAILFILLILLLTNKAMENNEIQENRANKKNIYSPNSRNHDVRNSNEGNDSDSNESGNKSLNHPEGVDNYYGDDKNRTQDDEGVSKTQERKTNPKLITAAFFIIIILIASITIAGIVKNRHWRKRVFKVMEKDIHVYVECNPGAQLSTIAYEFDTSSSTISYHLDILEKSGDLITQNGLKYKRYYVNMDGISHIGNMKI